MGRQQRIGGGDLHVRDDHADQRGDAGEVGDEIEDVDDKGELLDLVNVELKVREGLGLPFLPFGASSGVYVRKTVATWR